MNLDPSVGVQIPTEQVPYRSMEVPDLWILSSTSQFHYVYGIFACIRGAVWIHTPCTQPIFCVVFFLEYLDSLCSAKAIIVLPKPSVSTEGSTTLQA
jgi:hypothetical protein